MQIHTIGNGKSFLAESELRPLTSIYATSPMVGVSDQYRQIRTLDLIQLFAGQGWYPVTAQEQRTVKPEREGYQKHMVRFRQQGKFFNGVGDLALEIILTNAHDCTSAYSIMLGLFRMACLNGLIVSEGTFGAIKVIHKGFDPQEVIDASFKVIDSSPKLLTSIHDYKEIGLNQEEQKIYASSALAMKYAGEDDTVKREDRLLTIGERTFNLDRLLIPWRPEDKTPSLWNTYNNVQEKLTKGARFELGKENNWGSRRMNRARGITGINENLRVNKGLWHLMSEMAKLKGATAQATA